MIHRLHFSVEIDAEKSKIWNALWSDNSYREWANVFFEGSYAVTDNWDEKSTVLFLGPDKSGIYSLVEQHIPNELIRFKHIGTVSDGLEQSLDEESKKWTGATEEYSILEGKKNNTLNVEIDVLDEHLEFMKSTFPKALEQVKSSATNIN